MDWYFGDRTALSFVTPDGQLLLRVTVNLTDRPLPDGYTHIKDWSENEGIVEAGLVKFTSTRIPAGHSTAVLCRWLVQPPNPGQRYAALPHRSRSHLLHLFRDHAAPPICENGHFGPYLTY